MKIWEYKGSRRNIHGKWYFPGNRFVGEKPPSNDGFVMVQESDEIEQVIPEKKSDDDGISLELNELKMGELRKVGDFFGVKDTKKSELVEEIIEVGSVEKIREVIKKNRRGDI